MTKFTKKEKSWITYDWANSAYTLIIITTILPLFYKAMAEQAGIAASRSTAYWGYANSFATFLVAIMAPILGTIADYKDIKKKFFVTALTIGVAFTGVLAFVPNGNWIILLGVYILTMFGYAGANVFYDAFLVDVASEEKMDQVSSYGYAWGYIGSTIPFVVIAGMIFKHEMLGISEILAMRIGFFLTAIWWGVFSLPMIKNVKQRYYIDREPHVLRKSLRRLGTTLSNIRQHKVIFSFLIAYFFYIDGVGTIIKMAVVYGADVGLSATTLIVVLLAVQVVAFPFAILYGHLAKRFGTRTMIQFAIIVYIFTCFYAYQLDTELEYWVLGMLVASSQGGIQALSRSYYGKLIPKEKSNEFYGFYNIFGKFAAVMGPLLVGFVSDLTGRSQNGIFSIVALFIIGYVLLLRVPKTSEIL
ncbi:MFS transporter [Fusibacter sp. JL216-2]|uniref:MFS transporter n=1 Tax=Fusibacter sp. JL216-2 TaxID=3071453 RepID=UPI003D337E2E